MKSLSIIPILVMLLISSSCQHDSHYTKAILNDSSHDIWVINPHPLATCLNTSFDSTLVLKNSIYRYENQRYYDQAATDFEDCSIIMCTDTLQSRIATNDSLQLSFVIERNANWEYSEEKGFTPAITSCDCTLRITDADIN
jgi:hypothetical protein